MGARTRSRRGKPRLLGLDFDDPRVDTAAVTAELPHCALCRVSIKPAQNVVFRGDGRVQHVACPEVVCPVCSRPIAPDDPIRRDGETLVHGNCWMRRVQLARAAARGGGTSDGHAQRAAVICARLLARTLPPDKPTKTWGGYGSGQSCDACGERIPVGAPEYEVDFAQSVTLRFHPTCFSLWQKARETLA
jgi:hypothetical protein